MYLFAHAGHGHVEEVNQAASINAVLVVAGGSALVIAALTLFLLVKRKK